MQQFIKISVLLSIYGIFKEFRPSEPYLVPIMTEPPLNFTAEQVTQDIFPVSTYSTFVLLVIVFLLTDFLRYKIIIIIQAICAITTYLMIIFCRSVFEMQIMQVVYGLYLAGEVGYFTYIYAKVDNAHFQEVTSYTRSAYLLGKSLSGIASQVAVYFSLTSYQGLLWITVGSEVLALLWAITLPPVDRSVYFHRSSPDEDKTNREQATTNTINRCKQVATFLWNDFKTAFTNMYVLKWAIWWALATCGYFMVTYYVQVLWIVIREDSKNTEVQWNGVVETMYTLLGAVASMIMGKVKLNWEELGEPLLAACSLVIAGLLYIMSATNSIVVAYITFVLLTTIYQTMITVSNSEVAKNVNRESYGLVFGITTFVVYLIQSAFTYLALQVFQLKARPQFEVYAIYFAVLGVFFVATIIIRCISSKSQRLEISEGQTT